MMGRKMLLLVLFSVMVWASPVEKTREMPDEQLIGENNRAAMMTSVTKQTIKVKNKKFKCTIKLVHDTERVNLDKSSLKCTPGKPKKQKANNVEVSENGFVFKINLVINPSSITKATIVSRPTTTPIPTTTPTTPMPTTTPMETTTDSIASSTSNPLPGTSLPGGNCTCGQANRGTRVVNGEETEVNEYPWMAGLVSSGGSYVWCGATLISTEWVMTAAHCTESEEPGNIEVLLGEHDYYDDDETFTLRLGVAEIINHPKYESDTVDYDFSLLRLKEAVDFESFPHIRPVCLPSDPSEDYDGFLATVSGWGATTSGGSSSNYLQDADVNVLSNEECNGNLYAYSGAITERMMCANVEGGGTDSCQGDSGGPLVTPNPALYELIGVVSWGYGCAQPDAPGVYARMTKVLQWIATTTFQSWSSCGRCDDPTDCPGTVSVVPITEVPVPISSGSCIGSCTTTASDKCREGPCIFPFIYSNRMMTSCTSIDEDPTPWCATQVDGSGEMMTWGHCEGECPGTQESVINISQENTVGSCYCGVPNCEMTGNSTKIVGGTETCTGQYPWQVALLFFDTTAKNQGCGGTLIGAKYVMTAAHCTDGLVAEDINVIVGDTDLGSFSEALSFTMAVKTILQHENYISSPYPQNDISILELVEEIDLFAHPNIKPICLPTKNKVYADQDAVVSGWGTIASGGPSTSALNGVGVTIFADDNCADMTELMTEDMICAGGVEGGKDACQGDSGGPLITKDEDNNGAATLVGVVSWGFGCAVEDQPGIYAEVAHFLDWIDEKVDDLNTCPAPEQSSWIPGEPCCTNTMNYTMPPPTLPLFSTPSWPYTGSGISTFPFTGTSGPAPTLGNCTCGQAKQGTRVVNGEETEVNEFPWMAGLVSPSDDRVWCGATLISNLWVMTAAHCTQREDPESIEVLLGEHDYDDETETVSLRVGVEEIYIHPRYDPDTVDYDFSLLRLSEHVDFESYPHIRPVCLPLDLSEDYDGFLATVSGWGTTSSGGLASNYLQKADVNVLSNDECNGPSYAYDGAITDQMMCANVEGGGTDSCQGDSGGPLVTPNPDLYELIGVVSWGYGCAQADAPGVYARMTNALQWIASIASPSWNSCGRCEDPADCPATMPSPSLPPFSSPTWPQNYTGVSPYPTEDCCRYDDDCIPVNSRESREEKCEWVYCQSSSSGPTLHVYSDYDSVNCCMGEDDMMYQDGDEMVMSSGAMATCCKGRWMEPADV